MEQTILIPDPENTGVIYGSNGSTIASNGPLDIDVRRGNFHNIYGQVYSRQPFDIKVKQRFRVKAGHIRSGTSGKIKAGVLEVTRENPGAAQIVTNSYYRHYSRGGWLNHEEGDELIQEYGMRYWEQSHEGIIDITKETPGASGNLDLDCPEVL